MILDLIMIGLLAWQIWMPAVDNGKYMFQVDRDGTVIRMNTQTGEMVRCNPDLSCAPNDEDEHSLKPYKY